MTLHRLRHEEAVVINAPAILAVRQAVGTTRGDYVIDLILNDLLEGLIASEAALSQGDIKGLAKSAAQVAKEAKRLSLDNLCARATAACDVCQRPIEPSRPAVVQRMVRCGENSVAAVWRVLAVQARP
jgi:hypothetical protein